jgi:signal peptidase I
MGLYTEHRGDEIHRIDIMMAQEKQKKRSTPLFISICENLGSLANILAIVLVFHVFIAKGSVIPTGSMADNLRGDHFHLACRSCGYQYNYGYVPEKYINPQTGQSYWPGYRPGVPTSLVSDLSLRAQSLLPICPICGAPPDFNAKYYVNRGDQIWVLKCYYQFHDPKIWDVFVFKNPTRPYEDYIKRLIGCPGQTIEIIDGDVYINGEIQHKPPLVQQAMWITLFDSDFLPVLPPGGKKISPFAAVPFQPDQNSSAWLFDAEKHSWHFQGDTEIRRMTFDPDHLKISLAGYNAYNGLNAERRYLVSDLKIGFDLRAERSDTSVGLTLSKYGRNYTAFIDFNGDCSIRDEFQNLTLAETHIAALPLDRPIPIAFQNVDHRLTLLVNNSTVLVHDGPNLPADWGYRTNEYQTIPTVHIAGSGSSFTVNHIQLYRDTHYTNSPLGSNKIGRATEGHPFTLGPDEFFALGDNSPNSLDGRFWDAPNSDPEENLGQYPAGVVPREYIIGKPLCVYWPAAYRLPFGPALPIIPNAGEWRFIH